MKVTKKSGLEVKLLQQIHDLELPKPCTEVNFCDSRKWRFDIAWDDVMLAVEIEGGTWTGGRHIKPKGFENDCEKYNEAAIMGWVLLRFTSTMITDGRAIKQICKTYDHLYNDLIA